MKSLFDTSFFFFFLNSHNEFTTLPLKRYKNPHISLELSVKSLDFPFRIFFFLIRSLLPDATSIFSFLQLKNDHMLQLRGLIQIWRPITRRLFLKHVLIEFLGHWLRLRPLWSLLLAFASWEQWPWTWCWWFVLGLKFEVRPAQVEGNFGWERNQRKNLF